MAPNTKEHLSQARIQVHQASEALLSPTPEALDRCALLLEGATAKVALCYSLLTSGIDRSSGADEAVKAEARQLASAIEDVKLLLDAAFWFHQNWSRRLGAMSGGYTPAGEPAAVDRASTVFLRG